MPDFREEIEKRVAELRARLDAADRGATKAEDRLVTLETSVLKLSEIAKEQLDALRLRTPPRGVQRELNEPTVPGDNAVEPAAPPA